MENLREDIVRFLDSMSATVVRKKFCAMCGSVMEQRDSVFLYREQQWRVRLAVCPKCAPDSNRDDA